MADEMSLTMLRQTLALADDAHFEVLGVKMLVSEMLSAIEAAAPDVVVISSLGPKGARQARYLCKRMHRHFPKLRLVVARWGFRGNRHKLLTRMRAHGAYREVTTMAEAIDVLRRVQRVDGAAAQCFPSEPVNSTAIAPPPDHDSLLGAQAIACHA
jgi:hypothetical protein